MERYQSCSLRYHDVLPCLGLLLSLGRAFLTSSGLEVAQDLLMSVLSSPSGSLLLAAQPDVGEVIVQGLATDQVVSAALPARLIRGFSVDPNLFRGLTQSEVATICHIPAAQVPHFLHVMRGFEPVAHCTLSVAQQIVVQHCNVVWLMDRLLSLLAELLTGADGSAPTNSDAADLAIEYGLLLAHLLTSPTAADIAAQLVHQQDAFFWFSRALHHLAKAAKSDTATQQAADAGSNKVTSEKLQSDHLAMVIMQLCTRLLESDVEANLLRSYGQQLSLHAAAAECSKKDVHEGLQAWLHPASSVKGGSLEGLLMLVRDAGGPTAPQRRSALRLLRTSLQEKGLNAVAELLAHGGGFLLTQVFTTTSESLQAVLLRSTDEKGLLPTMQELVSLWRLLLLLLRTLPANQQAAAVRSSEGDAPKLDNMPPQQHLDTERLAAAVISLHSTMQPFLTARWIGTHRLQPFAELCWGLNDLFMLLTLPLP